MGGIKRMLLKNKVYVRRYDEPDERDAGKNASTTGLKGI